MKPHARLLIVPVILIAASLACNLPSAGNGTPQAAATLDQLYTAAAQTQQAPSLQAGSPTPGCHSNYCFPNVVPAHADACSSTGNPV